MDMAPPSPLSAPFWGGLEEGVLRTQRCEACLKLRFYPTESCPFCASTNFIWRSLSGNGHIYSWIVVYRSSDPAWQARTPYIPAIVEINEQEGVLIPGLLVGLEPSQVRDGLPVKAIFTRSNGRAIHRWTPTIDI